MVIVMNSKTTVKNILKVSFSNILKLLSGVLVGFLLPKIIGVSDYGFYKTFTLYGTYVGLFAIGITDGIYLKFGGFDYSSLDRERFRFYSKLFISMELIFSAIVGLYAFIYLKGDNQFIGISTAIFLFGNNVTGYYQIISQITGRFDEFSLRTILQSLLTSVVVIALWILSCYFNISISYKIYTFLYVLIILALTIWYMITYKEITFGKSIKSFDETKIYFKFIKIGTPLLVANLCSTLILTLDRQFVNVLFDTKTYAVYAFAYNMLSLITTALAAISIVIYPVMKRMDNRKLMYNYPFFNAAMLVLIFGCLSIYYPLFGFINWFLPNYRESLPIFRVILPGVALSSTISIIMHNYYKTLDNEKRFFIKSVITLAISGLANYFAYMICGTTISISIASVLVTVLWYIFTERGIASLNKTIIKNYLFIICMFIIFYWTTMINNWILGVLLYMVLFLIAVCAIYKSDYRIIKKIFF
ncbi:MAG: polysaccharide biosynthesis protein [Pseudobutyrivibrio ruminis]|nr:polysaccharide biosynthesis protein [Pseudobutyrivibrio ruminis]